MNGSIACMTEDRLRQLADDDLSPREWADLEGHVTGCGHCRALMDEIAADADWRQELRHAFSSGNDSNCTPGQEFLADDDVHQDGEGPYQRLLELLGPTDDPRMLGRIGPYEITGILGRGGMGVVFKGFDGALNRYVAIKMLLPHLATSGAARKRFAREAQASAAVVNDHVMAIHAVAEWQGMPYLVMPYSRGASLQKRLDDEGPLGVAEILRIGMQAAAGLAAAHAQGLVHRDVKPANILLADGVERVTLTDFGLARAVDDVSLTQIGVLAGTPPYMSPEQARCQSVDARSDLFSLGSVLYAMCTGRAPFRADSSYAVLLLVSDKEPCPMREINPEIPAWLCSIVSKLMAKLPDDRFATAGEVAELLQNCLAHLQQPANVPLPSCLSKLHPSAAPRRRLSLTIPVSIVAAALGLFSAGILGSQLATPSDADAKKDNPDADGKILNPPVQAPPPPKVVPATPEQQRAIATLQRLNATIKFDRSGRVFQVNFEPGAVVDDILEELLPLTEIVNLSLQGTKVTDAGLKHVAGFKKLQQLYLGQTTVTDAGLKELATLERLTHLGLENTHITDAGIHSISNLKNINYLNIGGTAITDGCLKAVGGFQQMGMLCLYSTAVTDAGMKELKGLTNLRTLLLNDTDLTDAGIKELEPLKQLKKIDVHNTAITQAGFKALKEAVPAVKLEADSDAELGHSGRSHSWLTAAGVVAGIVALSLVGVVLVVRKRQNGGKTQLSAEQLQKETSSPAVPLAVAVQCPNCQRKLRAKAELAGKAVKCPGCGSAVAIPGPEAALPSAQPAQPNG